MDDRHPKLSIQLERRGGMCTLTAAGEVDLVTSTQLKRALDDAFAVEPPPELVSADLSGIEFLDTTGLGLLLTARKQAEREGARFVVRSTSPTLDRLFAVTGVDAMLR